MSEDDDRYVAVPRFYDLDEYWMLSGLPFEVKKPTSSDCDPDVTDVALD